MGCGMRASYFEAAGPDCARKPMLPNVNMLSIEVAAGWGDLRRILLTKRNMPRSAISNGHRMSYGRCVEGGRSHVAGRQHGRLPKTGLWVYFVRQLGRPLLLLLFLLVLLSQWR